MLANRLRKQQRHLRKWARHQGVTCFRLYERDIPEYPLIVDWYDGEAVVWLYDRIRDETPTAAAAYREQALAEILAGLELRPEQLFVKERERQKGLQNQYERVAQSQHVRVVLEQGLRFEVNLSDYLDTGLFLDHRQTRAMVRDRAAGQRCLNLFAYTGAFTCYAAAGGAIATTTVDMSRTYTQWAERNLGHNGFAAGRAHRLVTQDCFQFLAEAGQRREQYDLVVCDPPTFSNSSRMKRGHFEVEEDHPELINACLRLLTPGGVLFFSTNSRRFKLGETAVPAPWSARELTPQTIPEDFRNQRIHRCWLISM